MKKRDYLALSILSLVLIVALLFLITGDNKELPTPKQRTITEPLTINNSYCNQFNLIAKKSIS